MALSKIVSTVLKKLDGNKKIVIKIIILTILNISLFTFTYFYRIEAKTGTKIINYLIAQKIEQFQKDKKNEEVDTNGKLQVIDLRDSTTDSNLNSTSDPNSTSLSEKGTGNTNINADFGQSRSNTTVNAQKRIPNSPPSVSEFTETLLNNDWKVYAKIFDYSNVQSPGLEDGKGWLDYPDTILQITRDSKDLLLLTNKRYQIHSSYAPTDLTKLNVDGIRTISTKYIRSVVIPSLQKMGMDAKADGIDLLATSTYRSYSTQEGTYAYWRNKMGSRSEADKISARAGHSQHQLGVTIDFASSESGNKIGTVFEGTQAQLWLAKNAWKYGFAIGYPKGQEKVTGYSYECWHFRWIGEDNARVWHDSGLSLEVWLRIMNDVSRGWGM